jgi:UDP-N-acetylglucosamine diphosphorylase/glucosamine-1-phosphate N-acetyltransferase
MTQIKGGCSIGPVCKLGGEINSVIIQGWSNKSHDGYLGDAYLGQWVNLGAGTVNSNLKNNYSDINVMVNGVMSDTGSKHVGCFMGDHVKTAIGTRLNTGTVIGTGSNVVSNGFPPKSIPPFSWCVDGKVQSVRWESFLETTKIVKSRRGLELSAAEKSLLDSIYRRKKT